jgi:protein TonB
MREAKMLIPRHEPSRVRDDGITPRRAIALSGVGLLHVAAVYALVTGMTPQIAKLIPPDIQIDIFDQPNPTKPVVPLQPILTRPTDATQLDPKLPDIKIADPENNAGITVSTTSHPLLPSNSGLTGVGSTHSTPPYPDQARTLSHQGTVLLQLTVSPNGDVVAADIVRTSGFAELDSAAVSWVLAHWKYKPALEAGVAVTSRTQAAVKFDLKQTRG